MKCPLFSGRVDKRSETQARMEYLGRTSQGLELKMDTPSRAKRARIALVGAGRMGQLRAAVLYANPRVQFALLVEPAAALGRALADTYGLQLYNDLNALLDAHGDSLDAVCISTPTHTHAALIEAAANRGLHVFTEKPVGERPADIARSFATCHRHSVHLCCGFQRRFDASYAGLCAAVHRGDIGQPSMIHVFFADHPAPPMEFMRQGGDPFMDLSVHDLDFVRWVLDGDTPVEVFGTGSSSSPELREAGVLDNATLYVKFSGGAVCNIMMSRGSTYGYDQRCSVYGDRGIVSVESSKKTSVTVGTETGFLSDRLQHSFPQCFREAFEREMEVFASVVLGEAAWPVGEEDCVAAQLIASCAALSCSLGRPVAAHEIQAMLTSGGPASISLRPIGKGGFGRFMCDLLRADASLTNYTVLPPYSPSSGLHWESDVLGDAAVDAVYVCSPDARHCEQAAACLCVGKHVLVEKPVYDFEALRTTHARLGTGDEQRAPALLVGFQRRFDGEFMRLKRDVEARMRSGEGVSAIVIESRDPVPADPNLLFVLRNSMCHDLDMASWLFSSLSEFSWAIEFGSCEVAEATSSIVLDARMTVCRTDRAEPVRHIDMRFQYSKLHTSYVQRVTMNGRLYGYDYSPPEDTSFCTLYTEAYVSQWKQFSRQLSPVSRETWAEEQARLDSYSRSFALLAKAEQLLKMTYPDLPDV